MFKSFKSLWKAFSISFVLIMAGLAGGCGGGGGAATSSSAATVQGVTTPSTVSVVTAK